jgi:hypothetical protein
MRHNRGHIGRVVAQTPTGVQTRDIIDQESDSWDDSPQVAVTRLPQSVKLS